MKKVILAVPVLLLTACGDKDVTVPIVTSLMDSSGNLTQTVTEGTVTASTFKEQVVMQTLQNRDNNIRAAHANSGFKLVMKPVEKTYFFPGMTEPVKITEMVITEVSNRDQADFNQVLPTKPSDHPVWDTTKAVAVKALDVGLWAFGIDRVMGAWETVAENASQYFYGDNEFNNSFNTAGTSQNFENMQYRGDYTYTPPEESGSYGGAESTESSYLQ